MPAPSDKKKILVVEDHPAFRAMLVQLIEEQLGATVCGEADNVQDALVLIEHTRPDAAIIDLNLRGPGGLELIKELIARNVELPVLVLSMHEEGLYREQVLRAGAKGFVSKQASPQEMAAALRTVMAGRLHLGRSVSETVLEQPVCGGQPLVATDRLSGRELEVFQCIGHGLTTPEIARQTRLEPSVVDGHRAGIKQKLGIKNAAELYQHAAQWVAREGGNRPRSL